jgi:ABC-type proline/glycine betaine transport system ATPase subunit
LHTHRSRVEVRPRCGANQIVWSFVAFPRAIPPPALLPFAILEVRERYGVTVLFVTHDIDESVYLGDRIVVLTPSPTSVQEQLDVELPQPRDQVQTKERQEFAQLRAHVYRAIKRRTETRPEETTAAARP